MYRLEMTETSKTNMKGWSKRSALLGSMFILLLLKLAFTQIILYPGQNISLSTSVVASVNPIQKEIEEMDAINKKLAALSFGAPVPKG